MKFLNTFINMSSSEETDGEIVWTDYTDRHKRRLAHKRSLNEFTKIYKKVKRNRVYNIANNNDGQIDFSCNSRTCKKKNTSQHSSNDVQMLAEKCKLMNEEILNKYNINNESKIQSENEENDVENAVKNTQDIENTEINNRRDSEVVSNTSYELEENDFDIENTEINNRRDSEIASNTSYELEENDFDIENTEINNQRDSEAASNTSYELEENDFKSEITQWAADYKIHINALTSLLQILKKRSNVKLPKDGRTLMCTPRATNITSMDKGFYSHFGVEPAICKIIEDRINSKIDNLIINLIISTDGAPIGISSGKVMWPILCSDELLPKVRVIGIYYGENKPADSNKFLEAFVNELIPLINVGYEYNGICYKIRLHALVCDTPAKAFILKVKNHTGYDSCTKCLIHGNRIEYTNCFPMEKNQLLLRDDEVFRNFGYSENYQIGETILKNIPYFGAVSNVTLDYMHLVCLGVMRKLIFLWLRGPLNTRLSSLTVQQISDKLLTLKEYTPSDFPRKPRSLEFIKLWKATEFRQFLLYSGPIILKNILNKNVYENFLTLHIAIRILASTEHSKNPQLLEYAEKLLNTFVQSFTTIYGVKYVSHNVHNLLHLTSDVKRFGALDGFSAFQFESYIFQLKKLVRKGDKPLQQITKRLYELNVISQVEIRNKKFFLKKNHKDGPLDCEHEYKEQYKILNLGSFHLKCDDKKNNCVLLKDNTVVCVYNIAKSKNNNIYIIGKKLIPDTSLFTIPCESQFLGIAIVKQNKCIESWLYQNICAKVYKIPYKDKFVILPILHTIVSHPILHTIVSHPKNHV
ncbi:uncharacterized protein [Linepithema humile]|uniref:uncharacterized protein n=1 Tax=Linepithema humile TaxID=83485 RepID=UPI00351E6BDB